MLLCMYAFMSTSACVFGPLVFRDAPTAFLRPSGPGADLGPNIVAYKRVRPKQGGPVIRVKAWRI